MAGHGDPALQMGDRHLSGSPLESAHVHEHVSTSTQPTAPSSHLRRPAIVAGQAAALSRPKRPNGPQSTDHMRTMRGMRTMRAESRTLLGPFSYMRRQPVAGYPFSRALRRCQNMTTQLACSPPMLAPPATRGRLAGATGRLADSRGGGCGDTQAGATLKAKGAMLPWNPGPDPGRANLDLRLSRTFTRHRERRSHPPRHGSRRD